MPAKGWVENMILVLPNPFKKDTWVTSIEIRPGVTAAMHHAGIRFAPHTDGVRYGKFYWSDIKRDEAGFRETRLEAVKFVPLLMGKA